MLQCHLLFARVLESKTTRESPRATEGMGCSGDKVKKENNATIYLRISQTQNVFSPYMYSSVN